MSLSHPPPSPVAIPSSDFVDAASTVDTPPTPSSAPPAPFAESVSTPITRTATTVTMRDDAEATQAAVTGNAADAVVEVAAVEAERPSSPLAAVGSGVSEQMEEEEAAVPSSPLPSIPPFESQLQLSPLAESDAAADSFISLSQPAATDSALPSSAQFDTAPVVEASLPVPVITEPDDTSVEAAAAPTEAEAEVGIGESRAAAAAAAAEVREGDISSSVTITEVTTLDEPADVQSTVAIASSSDLPMSMPQQDEMLHTVTEQVSSAPAVGEVLQQQQEERSEEYNMEVEHSETAVPHESAAALDLDMQAEPVHSEQPGEQPQQQDEEKKEAVMEVTVADNVEEAKAVESSHVNVPAESPPLAAAEAQPQSAAAAEMDSHEGQADKGGDKMEADNEKAESESGAAEPQSASVAEADTGAEQAQQHSKMEEDDEKVEAAVVSAVVSPDGGALTGTAEQPINQQPQPSQVDATPASVEPLISTDEALNSTQVVESAVEQVSSDVTGERVEQEVRVQESAAAALQADNTKAVSDVAAVHAAADRLDEQDAKQHDAVVVATDALDGRDGSDSEFEMVDAEEAKTDEEASSSSEEDDEYEAAPSFTLTAQRPTQPAQRADSPTFGLTQPDTSDVEISSQESSSQYDSSQQSQPASRQAALAAPAVAVDNSSPRSTAVVAAQDTSAVSVAVADVDDERALSQQLHASQRSTNASTASDFDITAFILEADEQDEDEDEPRPRTTHPTADDEDDEQVEQIAHKDDDSAFDDDEESVQADSDAAVKRVHSVDEKKQELGADEIDDEEEEEEDGDAGHDSDVEMEADEDDSAAVSRPSPPSPTALSTSSSSNSPVFSQSDVDTLHARIAQLQATIDQLQTTLKEAQAKLRTQEECDDIRRACFEEAERETRASMDEKQRQLTALQRQLGQHQQQAREAESKLAALHSDVQRLQSELANEREQSLAAHTDAVEAMRAKEEQLHMVRAEKEDSQRQVQLSAQERLAQQQSLEAEIDRLTELLGQREAELAQLTATPLAHRVDALQQQLHSMQAERDEAVKQKTKLEAKLKTIKKESKESRKQWEVERAKLEQSNASMSSLLQDLSLKHSETTTKLSYREDQLRKTEEQIRALEADKREHQQTDRELTQLRVKEELMRKEVDRLYADKKEAVADVKALRDELRSLHDRMREEDRNRKEEREGLQRQIESIKANESQLKEKLSVATERQSNTKQQLDTITKDSTKEIKTLREDLRLTRDERTQLQHRGMQLEVDYGAELKRNEKLLQECDELENERNQLTEKNHQLELKCRELKMVSTAHHSTQAHTHAPSRQRAAHTVVCELLIVALLPLLFDMIASRDECYSSTCSCPGSSFLPRSCTVCSASSSASASASASASCSIYRHCRSTVSRSYGP